MRDEGGRVEYLRTNLLADRLEEVDERGHAALGCVGRDVLEGVTPHVPQLGQLRVTQLHALRAGPGGARLALLTTQLDSSLGIVSRVGVRALGARRAGGGDARPPAILTMGLLGYS